MNMSDSRIRLIAVYIMLINSDRAISLGEIQSRLDRDYNITANRKTLYNDFNAITLFEDLRYFPNEHGYRIVREEVEEQCNAPTANASSLL